MSTQKEIQADQQQPKKTLNIKKLGINPIIFVATVVITVVFMPTFILLLGGMIPSMIAYIFDTTRKKSKAKTVSYMNLAGCFIVGMELWSGDNSIDAAIGIFLQPVNWVVMYGMGMAGWILIKCLNPFITSYLRLNYQIQQRNLRKRRKQLLSEWGEPVTTVSTDGNFVYDKNVYLDEDDVTHDPDENIDILDEENNEYLTSQGSNDTQEQEETLQITSK